MVLISAAAEPRWESNLLWKEPAPFLFSFISPSNIFRNLFHKVFPSKHCLITQIPHCCRYFHLSYSRKWRVLRRALASTTKFSSENATGHPGASAAWRKAVKRFSLCWLSLWRQWWKSHPRVCSEAEGAAVRAQAVGRDAELPWAMRDVLSGDTEGIPGPRAAALTRQARMDEGLEVAAGLSHSWCMPGQAGCWAELSAVLSYKSQLLGPFFHPLLPNGCLREEVWDVLTWN